MLQAADPTGPPYLAAVTEVLHRSRLGDPTAGIWEAADLQWWWRRDQHHDPGTARVWYDGDAVVCAAVLTRWRPDRIGVDVLGDATRPEPWAWLADRLQQPDLVGLVIETTVRDGDEPAVQRADALGFTHAGEPYLTLWRDAAPLPNKSLPDLGPGPAAYRLVSRAEEPDRRHWLAPRSGEDIAERLAECSIYDATCDLAVIGPEDEPAAYALFWPDRVTGVGLVEPVRVEEAHQGRRLSSYLLRAGLRLLAERGCTRMKIGVEEGNVPAERAYVGAGFRPVSRETTLRRDVPFSAYLS